MRVNKVIYQLSYNPCACDTYLIVYIISWQDKYSMIHFVGYYDWSTLKNIKLVHRICAIDLASLHSHGRELSISGIWRHNVIIIMSSKSMTSSLLTFYVRLISDHSVRTIKSNSLKEQPCVKVS